MANLLRGMMYLYLFYGASFFTLGVLLAFQARLPSGVLPRTALWWFSAFAVIHALSEWAKMLALAPSNAAAVGLKLVASGRTAGGIDGRQLVDQRPRQPLHEAVSTTRRSRRWEPGRRRPPCGRAHCARTLTPADLR